MEKFDQLEILSLGGNEIEEPSYLTKLTEIKFLGLRSNKISEFYQIKELGNLTNIDISLNPLRKLPNVNLLRNLKTLRLQHKAEPTEEQLAQSYGHSIPSRPL